jgi:hypothetical protein
MCFLQEWINVLSTGKDYGVFYRNGLRCFLQEWIKVFSTGMD